MARRGDSFGRWTVVDLKAVPVPRHNRPGRLETVAECVCDCGVHRLVALSTLRSGRSTSCGCRRAEVSRDRWTTHGMSAHPLFGHWEAMMSRCYREGDVGYRNYGGRGISVWPGWHDPRVYLAYLDAVLGPKPEGHTIDKIDNDGNYEPGNIRWADRVTQNNNRSRRGSS